MTMTATDKFQDAADAYVHIRKADHRVIADGYHSWQSTREDIGGARRDVVFARWELSSEGLRVVTDRHGIHPLYVWSNGRQAVVSPSIPRLLNLGAPPDLDIPAFSAFLRLGFFLGNDTPFASIRAFPGGETLVRLRPDWRVQEHDVPYVPANKMSRNSAIDAYVELFEMAIKDAIQGSRRIAVPLSGGRDSRHILLEMLKQGRRPDLCLTASYYPPRSNADVEVASDLAKHLGLRHRIVSQMPSQLKTILRHIQDTGYCTLTPSSFVQPIADTCLAENIDCILDGLAGDTLSAGHFSDEQAVKLYSEQRYHELAEKMLGRFQGMDEALIQAMLAPEWRDGLSRDVARERVIRELKRHVGAPNPMASFVFYNRTRRDIALMPLRVYRRVPTVICPYLLPELFDFLFSLPAEMVVDHQFHDEAIRRAYPDMRSFRYAEGSADDRRDSRHERRFSIELARHIVHPGRRGLVLNRYVWPRIVRCAIDRRYRSSISWFGPSLVYLAELSSVLAKGSSLQRGESFNR